MIRGRKGWCLINVLKITLEERPVKLQLETLQGIVTYSHNSENKKGHDKTLLPS